MIKRLNNPDASWKELAGELKLDGDAIQPIALAMIEERENLITKEYAYVVGKHQIHDGSPTLVWESERIKYITIIKPFKNLTFSDSIDSSCSN